MFMCCSGLFMSGLASAEAAVSCSSGRPAISGWSERYLVDLQAAHFADVAQLQAVPLQRQASHVFICKIYRRAPHACALHASPSVLCNMRAAVGQIQNNCHD